MTTRDPRLAMSEAALEEHVRQLCKDLAVYRYHVPDSRRSESGFPDDVLVGPHGVLFRELKTERGPVAPRQKVIHTLLVMAGADFAVWRPRDLLSGQIAAEIAAVSRVAGQVRTTSG